MIELLSYPSTFSNVSSFLNISKTTASGNLSQYSAFLIFQSREDHIVPKISATYTMKKLGSKDKELIWLENSYHVAPLDYDKELIAKKSKEFIDRLSS